MSRAQLPPDDDYHRPRTLFDDERGTVVRIHPEGGGPSKEYLFARLHLASDITRSFAAGFARAAGPGGTVRSPASVDALFSVIRAYAKHLNMFPNPPTTVEELTRAHIAELRLRGTRYGNQIVHGTRRCLRGEPRLPDAYRQLLFAPMRAVEGQNPVAGYTATEFRQIRRAARTTVRAALTRIRGLEVELDAWRATRDPSNLRGVHLDYIARVGDVPRYAGGAVRRDASAQGAAVLAEAFFPSPAETAAAATLMICMTGQNLSTLCSLTNEYLRADDQRDRTDPGGQPATKVALTDTTKLRRGRHAAEQDTPLTSAAPEWLDPDTLPDDDPTPPLSGTDDYASPFGVYLILDELCRRSRVFAGTDALLCSFSTKRVETTPHSRGFRVFAGSHLAAWSGHVTDTGSKRVDSRRLRRAFVEMHQRPVDHKVSTLARDYLAKDVASLAQNQVVVHDVLTREAARIRTTHTVRFLSEDDLHAAAQNPQELATRLDVSIPVLTNMLAGALDTVAAACVDNTHSPHSPAGVPCTASFLLCLGCPCARSEPRHIPVQAALSNALDERRLGMDDAAWDAQFGTARARLGDLLTEQRADIPAAASTATPEQHQAITALLDGHLEIR